jgi:hypothetical protein
MAKQTALFLFIGVLAVPALANPITTCGEDEMDLCVDSTDIKSTTCAEDEMDLCVDLHPCDSDEMDLCIDLPSPVVDGGVSTCAEDEMDLCTDVDYVATQAPTPAPVTFTGTLTFTVNGNVEKVEVEMAAKKTIELSLPAGSEVFVTATKSRRLETLGAASRRLQSSWSVAWQADVPESSASTADAALEFWEQDNAGFQTQFKTQLVAAGCDAAVAESMEVKSFQSERVIPTTTNNVMEIENTDSAMGLSGKFSIVLAIMVSSFMSPSRTGLVADVLGVKASAAAH